MKRKIDATNGTTYIYKFSDGSKVTLTAGQDGVTEDMIRQLKRMDNRQYEKDLDYSGRKPTKEEKEQWEAEHPDEKMSRIWNPSLDFVNADGAASAEEYLYHQQIFDEDSNSKVDRLHELIEEMPPKRKLVVSLYLQGYKLADIARELELNPSTVKEHMKSAKKFIKKYF